MLSFIQLTPRKIFIVSIRIGQVAQFTAEFKEQNQNRLFIRPTTQHQCCEMHRSTEPPYEVYSSVLETSTGLFYFIHYL